MDIVDTWKDFKGASKIILPGQGRFGSLMNLLKEKKLERQLVQEINKGKLYLGICVGLQILFEQSEEDPEIKGLGIFKGEVKGFAGNLKIPQIGWNKVENKHSSVLLKGLKDDYFYFVNSYFAYPDNQKIVKASTRYGQIFASLLEFKNIFAAQFHPEKSGRSGLKLLKNFCEVKSC